MLLPLVLFFSIIFHRAAEPAACRGAADSLEECGRNVGRDEECGDRRDVHQFYFRLSSVKKLGYVPSVPRFSFPSSVKKLGYVPSVPRFSPSVPRFSPGFCGVLALA